MVRQIVIWCGEPDPGETRDEMAQNADVEGNALAALIRGWELMQDMKQRPQGLTAKQVVTELELSKSDESLDELRDAIDALCPGGGKSLARSLGSRLAHLRDRVVEGRSLSLNMDEKRSKAGYLWMVKQVTPKEPT